MKKVLLFVAVVGLSMTSCKKDRTCTCNITAVSSTVNGVSQPLQAGTITSVEKLTDVTKTGAHCNSGEFTETSTQTNGGVTYTQVDVYKGDCTLD